jgi:CAAD domains of cyanobacterial aminoacyl-tRNA synthetase
MRAMENNTSEFAPPEVATAKKPKPMKITDSSEGTLSKVSADQPSLSSEQDWQGVAQEKLAWLLTEFPEQFDQFFGEYKKPITTAGLVLTAVPFVALSLALLEVINAIPFFAPVLELIGFGYSSWFIYRYLLFADRRQDFSQNLKGYKEQILGDKTGE